MFTKSEPIVLTSNLEIYEKVYKGPTVDLGKQDAKFSFTIWYRKSDDNFSVPLVAEISFKYKLEDEKDTFPQKVVRRAKDLFDEIQSMPFVDITSSTKTQMVYGYANFCG